ncbi:MAG: hypothetical protein ACHP9V_00200 [Terriglobales bacterium]
MINKLYIGMALIVLSVSALSQSKDSRIGDDYAKAALRAVIYTNESGIPPERVSFLMDEADVEASTPAEEANLKELNHILGIWVRRPIQDNQVCYQALKTNLKARNGAIPEACK